MHEAGIRCGHVGARQPIRLRLIGGEPAADGQGGSAGEAVEVRESVAAAGLDVSIVDEAITAARAAE